MGEAEQAMVTEELTAAVARVDAASRKDNDAAGEALVSEGLQWLQPSETSQGDVIRCRLASSRH